MRIIFLDFDGVLNSYRTATACGNYPHDLSPESRQMFDWISIDLIKKFCVAHEVKIVVSSTWRKCFPHELLARVFGLPIIGAIPLRISDGGRGLDIQRWLNKNPEVLEYAIIDDDADMLPEQMGRLVKTDPHNGFMWEDYLRLHKIFGVAQKEVSLPKPRDRKERCNCVQCIDPHGIEIIKMPSGKDLAIGGTDTPDRFRFCPFCGGYIPKETAQEVLCEKQNNKGETASDDQR